MQAKSWVRPGDTGDRWRTGAQLSVMLRVSMAIRRSGRNGGVRLDVPARGCQSTEVVNEQQVLSNSFWTLRYSFQAFVLV